MVKYDYKMRHRITGACDYYLNKDGSCYRIDDGSFLGELSQRGLEVALSGQTKWELIPLRPLQLENK